MKSIAAFILAGGRSSRMGADKAFLELAGKPLIVRAVELARETVPDVKIVGDARKFAAFGTVIEDVYCDRGPLGGIHAALTNTLAEWNLLLAVDLPFIPARFLQFLLARAESSNAAVTVPSLGNHFQPLCAVYRKSFASVAERSLSEGKNKIDRLFREVTLCALSEEELSANGFDGLIFRNLNTPEEWQAAKQDFRFDS
ncbi:MAG TPA: molybdenum cofactor guanylyltransferase [Terriglobales bacterium]|nr:molybdenum cofactor guanylyltransferase [Terriglobales bacterium]